MKSKSKNFSGEAASAAPELDANQQSLWKQVIETVKSRSTTEKNCDLIVLGNYDVGKSSVIRALQTVGSQSVQDELIPYEDTDAVALIDSAYLGIRRIEDEIDAQNAELEGYGNIWILQSRTYSSLLVERLKQVNTQNLAILICLNLERAWDMLKELRSWLDLIIEMVQQIHIPSEKKDELRSYVDRYMYIYRKDSTDSGQLHSQGTHLLNNKIGNVGLYFDVPIVVAVCKSDFHKMYNTRESPGLIDVIIAYIRRALLPYGSALIFCNTKDRHKGKNCLLLYRYLMHRIFGFTFKEVAEIENKELIFYPTGFDSEEQVEKSIQATTVGNFETPYEAIVCRPTSTTKTGEKTGVVQMVNSTEFFSQLAKDYPMLIASSESTSTHQSTEVRFVSKGSMEFDAKGGGNGTVDASASGHDGKHLESFFKGLLAKGRGKGTATMNTRPRRDSVGANSNLRNVDAAFAMHRENSKGLTQSPVLRKSLASKTREKSDDPLLIESQTPQSESDVKQ